MADEELKAGDLVSKRYATMLRVGKVRRTYDLEGEQRCAVEFPDGQVTVFFAHELILETPATNRTILCTCTECDEHEPGACRNPALVKTSPVRLLCAECAASRRKRSSMEAFQ